MDLASSAAGAFLGIDSDRQGKKSDHQHKSFAAEDVNQLNVLAQETAPG
jgi:hypothetical protein